MVIAAPHPAPDPAVLDQLVRVAGAAPSVHNTQPWRFRWDARRAAMEVHVEPDRALPHMDPDGRELLISVGAAVFNLRVAVRHAGWEPVVHLLPDAGDPGLAASVQLTGRRAAHGRSRDTRLLRAALLRHSSRLPFTSGEIHPDVRRALVDAALDEGADLAFPDPAETRRLLILTRDAQARALADRERRAETQAWVRGTPSGPRGPLGIPPESLGARDSAGRLPMRDFAGAAPGDPLPAAPRRLRQYPALFEPDPRIAVLATPHDEPADRLRAGQALQHVLLEATASGLQTSMFTQALEWPDLRWALRDHRRGPGHVQMLIRLGHGARGPASPRLPAAALLRPEA